MNKNIYLDHAAATPLSDEVKKYLISILDEWGNPSSLHMRGVKPRQIIAQARLAAAEFINADTNDIIFVPSGCAGNTLAVKGLTSGNPQLNRYEVFYTPTSHKSMRQVCKSCLYHTPLKVNTVGETDLSYLSDILTLHDHFNPLVCIEAANSEIGTINDVIRIGSIVHRHNGILAVDATGYIPSCRIDMKLWKDSVDILTFSGHKLHALKGIGVLWKKNNIVLKPLIYGSQQNGIVGGTENVIGIASLSKALEHYDYSSVSPSGRDHVYNYIIQNIPDSYLVGPSIDSGNRLPLNLYMCFKGVEGESLMILLDMNGIQVSTGSACTGRDLTASAALTAIGMNRQDIHSCIRLSFSGKETKEDLDYICSTLKQCVADLRNLNI